MDEESLDPGIAGNSLQRFIAVGIIDDYAVDVQNGNVVAAAETIETASGKYHQCGHRNDCRDAPESEAAFQASSIKQRV